MRYARQPRASDGPMCCLRPFRLQGGGWSPRKRPRSEDHISVLKRRAGWEHHCPQTQSEASAPLGRANPMPDRQGL